MGQPLEVYATGIPAHAMDLEFGSTGELYVTGCSDSGGVLVRVPAGGGAAETFARGLTRPWGLARSPSGTVYVVDRGDSLRSRSGKIWSVSPSGRLRIYRSGLDQPGFAVCDSSGNLFIGMLAARKIVRFGSNGAASDWATGLGETGFELGQLSIAPTGEVQIVAGTSIVRVAHDGTIMKIVPWTEPSIGQVQGRNEHFFVTSPWDHQLAVTGADMPWMPLLGNASDSPCAVAELWESGEVSRTTMSEPAGMRLRDGHMYVVDGGCGQVRRFDLVEYRRRRQPLQESGIKSLYR